MHSLAGKTAVVTGGGSGIGLAAAQALAAAGCRVAIGGRRAERLEQAAARWTAPTPLLRHQLDVADRHSVDAFFRWADAELGPLDILVHSAGVNIKTRSMKQMTPEQWDEVLAINATGGYNCIRAVLPAMRERGEGLIIAVSSVAGKRASQLGGVAYSASKFALSALCLAVANEAAEDGVRVSVIYPGEVNTPILDQRPEPVSEAHRRAILQPEDVGAAVAALAALPPRAHVPELIIKPLRQPYA